MRLTRLFAAIIFLGCASVSVAGPITADTDYILGNHPDGNAADPLYGLRLDGLLTGQSADIYTFDFGAGSTEMRMHWDSNTNALRIWGHAYGGHDIGSGYAPGSTADWFIDFLYTDMYACGSNSLCSDTGGGTLSSTEFGIFNMVPVGAAMHGYTFRLEDGHRGFAGTSGYGWVNHCEAGNNPSTIQGSSCNEHMYASDWLFTAETAAVAEPGTLALLGMGLLGMSLTRRRTST